jgi:RHS repeat-associated protein
MTTSALYNGASVLLERQGSTTTATYTYGNALVRKDGETPLFDGLGSERTVTNTGGAVQGTLTMTAFGQSVASTGSSTDPYEFAATSGYRNDGDAGLMLVGARYYDAQTGSFISRDTYLDQLPYGYCDGDPVNGVDPSGHDGLDSLGGGMALLATAWAGGFALQTAPVAVQAGIGITGMASGTAISIGCAAVGGWIVGAVIADHTTAVWVNGNGWWGNMADRLGTAIANHAPGLE